MKLIRLKVNLLLYAFGFARKFFGIDFPPAPTVSAIIPRAKKILVIKSNYRRGLALPGGYLKGKENFLEGLRREVKEETALQIVSAKYFNTYSTYSTVGGFPKVTVCYVARVKGTLKSSEEGEVIWIDPTQIKNKIVYMDNKKALSDYLSRKK